MFPLFYFVRISPLQGEWAREGEREREREREKTKDSAMRMMALSWCYYCEVNEGEMVTIN